MKDLIRHFMRYPENLTGLRNCHAKGVDSILLDAPNTKFRVFIANTWHDLWKNSASQNEIMSVGFHNHHCDVELIHLNGTVYNIGFTDIKSGDTYLVYDYKSKINSKYLNGNFILQSNKCNIIEQITRIDKSLFLDAFRFHTISVPFGTSASWLVIEGKENPDYKPITISNNPNLESETFEGYYEKINSEEFLKKLEEIL